MSARGWCGAALAAAVAMLAGCAADRPKPAPLEAYAPKASARQLWSQRLGKLDFPLVPAVREGRVVAADSAGTLIAFAADTGAELWRASAGGALAAGVGSDGRYSSVVTRRNEVVTFDGAREIWRRRVPSSVVTPPFVAGERVFVLGVDRAVHAFDAQDGRRLWTLQRPGDPLTLELPGVLGAYRNTLLVGNGARLLGVDPLRGSVLWDAAMASPRGTNEVERLADLVGPPVRQGSRVCARAFQSAVACADAERGTTLWTRTSGGIQPLGGDAERVFGADAVDRVSAWRADNGDVVWTSERMLNRGLSGALAMGPYVVFGDFEGYLHFLDTASGEPQLRLATDGSQIVGAPLLAGQTMLVVTRDGGLFAFRQN